MNLLNVYNLPLSLSSNLAKWVDQGQGIEMLQNSERLLE